ncbi:hypothetical protein RhiirB3_421112 [Rhizophagus irregularis]|nr:hypothetical protein RhiirB3_421112 [Rhizophagus irregularis]
MIKATGLLNNIENKKITTSDNGKFCIICIIIVDTGTIKASGLFCGYFSELQYTRFNSVNK